MPASTTVSRMLWSLAGVYGVALDDVLARHGVDVRLLEDHDARIPGQLDMDLFDALAERARQPALGIMIASLPSPPSFDVADYVARHSPDLGSSYRALLRYQRLLFDHAPIELLLDGDEARLVHHPAPLLRFSRHATECMLGMMVTRGRALTGVDWTPRSVSFRHPAPDDTAPHRRLFRVDVAFGAPVTEVVLDATTLAYPNVAADPALFSLLERYAGERVAKLTPQSTFVDEARSEIARLMRGAVPPVADVARGLGMSARTLHRRLRADTRTFQQMVDEVRLAMARAYLADPRVKAVDVAFLLGFGDASAFYRAFRRWTRMTPIEYRAAIAKTGT